MLPITLLGALVVGCAPSHPTLAGGRPVSHWIAALQDPDPRHRHEAVFKLGNVGPGEKDVLPALTSALADRDAGVRREAIVALMKCGTDARKCIGNLEEMRRNDPDQQVRTYAAKALEKLQRDEAGTQ
jgi:HEAT repeat protein